MQVVKQDIEIYRDNDKDVVFEVQDGAGDPYDASATTFWLSVYSKPDRADANRLLRRQLTPVDGPTTELVWGVSAERSVMLAALDTLYYRLDRVKVDGKRKTWVTGVLRLLKVPSAMGAESAIVLQVNDRNEVIVVAVDDTSGARLAAELARDGAVEAKNKALEAQAAAEATDVGLVAARVTALEAAGASVSLSSDVTIAEAGTTQTPTLSWSHDIPAELASISINGTPITPVSVTEWEAPSITADTTYTITITDVNGATFTDSVSVDFRNRVYWGASASASLNAAAVLALGPGALATGLARSMTADAEGGLFVFYAFPASMGTVSEVVAYGLPVEAVISTINVTTAAGYTGPYTVVRLPEALDDDLVSFTVS